LVRGRDAQHSLPWWLRNTPLERFEYRRDDGPPARRGRFHVLKPPPCHRVRCSKQGGDRRSKDFRLRRRSPVIGTPPSPDFSGGDGDAKGRFGAPFPF
jgi:hypothetical protein